MANEHLTKEEREQAEAAAREDEKTKKRDKRGRGRKIAEGADENPWGFDSDPKP